MTRTAKKTRQVLSFVTVGGLLMLIIILIFVEIPPTSQRIFDILLGGLVTRTGSVFAHYFKVPGGKA